MDMNDFFRLMTMSGAQRDEQGNFQVGPAEMANFKMFAEQEQQNRDDFFKNSACRNMWEDKF